MILNWFASVKGDTEDVLWSSCRNKKNLHLICIALESLCITVYNELNLCVLEFIFMFFSDRNINFTILSERNYFVLIKAVVGTSEWRWKFVLEIWLMKLVVLTGSLQIWAYGRDLIPHCQPYRQVLRASNSSQKEASIGWADSHAISLQIWGSFCPYCGGSCYIMISDKAYTREEVLHMVISLIGFH